jgi:nucleotidyltransferase substrate binding protein (TIGR01987 family)
MAIITQTTEDALAQLKKALDLSAPSELERDGTIRCFEYCYELLWKLAQRVLKANGIKAEIPREVFRALGRIGWIDNVEAWLAFQKMRNLTGHEYGRVLAEKSYQLAHQFLPLAENLLIILKEKAQANE